MRTWMTILGVAAIATSMLALPAGNAWAARKKAEPSVEKPAKSVNPRAKRAKSGSTAESMAERDRRLSRECKGLPNAGACLGYAR